MIRTPMLRRVTASLLLLLSVTIAAHYPASAQENKGCASSPTAQPATEAEYVAALKGWIADLCGARQALKAAGLEGEFSVFIAFTILPDGTIRNIHIGQSSGNATANRIARDLLTNATGAPSFSPDMQGTERKYSVILVLSRSVSKPVE